MLSVRSGILAVVLALGACIGAAGLAGAVSAAPTRGATSCGAQVGKRAGCGPAPCVAIAPAEYNLSNTSPQGGARASLSRATGVAGTALSVTGSHWPAGEFVQLIVGENIGSNTQIYTFSGAFTDGKVDANGNLSIADIAFPGTQECTTPDGSKVAPQQVLVIAQTEDGKARISLPFTVYPAPQFIPTDYATQQAYSGSPETLVGSGWESNAKVTITPASAPFLTNGQINYDMSKFQQDHSAAMTVTSDAKGDFTLSVTLPQLPQETQVTYFASANGPLYGQVNILLAQTFIIYPTTPPTLTLSAASAHPGDSVMLTGANWPSDQQINIVYCETSDASACQPGVGVLLATPQTDDHGKLNERITIPAKAQPGDYTIRVSLVRSPFIYATDVVTQPFTVLYTFWQAHPRLTQLVHASPYIGSALALLIIGFGAGWWWFSRQRRQHHTADEAWIRRAHGAE